MSSTAVAGLTIFIVLVVILVSGMPIAVALAASSMIAIVQLLDSAAAITTASQKLFQGISIFTLLAIPFFVLAGNIMNKGGIAVRLINFAKVVIGWLPGSLVHVNILANMLFGAVSGSGAAAASAMGSVIGPIEEKEGMDMDFCTAVNVATAPTGLLIPPSNVLITYALASGGTSVAALFMGGYIPGILWGVGCMVVAGIWMHKHGYHSTTKYSFKEALITIWKAIPSLLLILIIVGGICSGIFTATEASGIAVVYSLFLSLIVYHTITVRELKPILLDSGKMTATIMFLVGTSNIMAWVMAFAGIPAAISNVLLSISSSKVVILLIINVFLLFVGTFMDITPAVLIFTPIFLPICQSFGMSALHFGIMITFNLCIGCITPPVGNILFVGLKVSKRRLEAVMKPLVLFYAAIFVVLMLVTFVPAVSTAIPSMLGY